MRKHPLPAPFIWHSYLLIFISGLLAALWPLPATICACLILAADSRLWRLRRMLFACSVFMLAFCLAAWHLRAARHAIDNAPAWLNRPSQRVTATVKYVRSLPDKRLRIYLENARPVPAGAASGADAPLPGYCVWTWEEPGFLPLPGQTVAISRPIRPIGGFANSGASAYEASMLAQKAWWRMWSRGWAGEPEPHGEPHFWAAVRQTLLNKFMAILAPSGQQLTQGQAILPALLFGDRFHLQTATAQMFAHASLAHSLALSGQHLGVAGILAWLAVIVIALPCPAIYLRMPRMPCILLLSLPLALLYLWLGNAPASLCRAAAMLAACAALMAGRKFAGGLDALCAAIALLLLFNPLAIYELGLQLSALCVAVIVICWPAIIRILRRLAAKTLRQKIFAYFLGIFLVSMFIQLALLPLTLSIFQQTGMWFPLNILWLPALGLFVLPLAAIGLALCAIPLAFCAQAAGLCIGAAAAPCQWLISLLAWLDARKFLAEPGFLLPFWPGLLAFALLTAAFACIMAKGAGMRKGRALICMALIALAIGPALRLRQSFDQSITLRAIDVGQGQAIFAQLPGGLRLLIDGGGSSSGRFDPGKAMVAPALADNAAPRLAAIVNTHPDQDHLGGLFYILDKFETSNIFHNGRPAANPLWQGIQAQAYAHSLAAGDKIRLGPAAQDMWLEVLSPPDNAAWLRGNAASLILRLTWRKKGIALFCGDAERENLRQLIDAGADLRALAVFAPHHGSDKNLLPAFYQAAQPEAVIASCGFLNRYRYPGKKLAACLDKLGIPLFDTGNHGKITAHVNANGQMTIQTVK